MFNRFDLSYLRGRQKRHSPEVQRLPTSYIQYDLDTRPSKD